MTNPRKKIILNEILFWKQNKLLPEHYCDFLATLYNEGQDEVSEEEAKAKQAILAQEKKRNTIITTALMIGTVLTFIGMFIFTTFSWVFTMLGIIVTTLLFVRASVVQMRAPSLAILYHIVAALLVFSLTVSLAITYFPHHNMVLISVLIGNSILWLVVGLKRKLVYFTISGICACVVVIAYSVYIAL